MEPNLMVLAVAGTSLVVHVLTVGSVLYKGGLLVGAVQTELQAMETLVSKNGAILGTLVPDVAGIATELATTVRHLTALEDRVLHLERRRAR